MSTRALTNTSAPPWRKVGAAASRKRKRRQERADRKRTKQARRQ